MAKNSADVDFLCIGKVNWSVVLVVGTGTAGCRSMCYFLNTASM